MSQYCLPSRCWVRRESLHNDPIISVNRISGSSQGSNFSSLYRNSPSGVYPVPVTSTILLPAMIFWTVILFLVSVPVLSVQITLAAPNVSTAGKRRMMAFRLAIRFTPMARVMLITAGKPSGMADTAVASAYRNTSCKSKDTSNPTPTITKATTNAMMPNFLLRSNVWIWRGDSAFSVSWIRVAILPISVSLPVA